MHPDRPSGQEQHHDQGWDPSCHELGVCGEPECSRCGSHQALLAPGLLFFLLFKASACLSRNVACVFLIVANYAVAYLSASTPLASCSMEDRCCSGIHYRSVVKEAVVCRITNVFSADVEINEAGGYRKSMDDLSRPGE